ncbi:DUF3618 domain-containing protein [Aeromicrobium fastidiosum]|uniref:DUF3618 domain-containing protein n=1 Tax=Aeromicrobium fastidiosum TaxID=52699 RepID=A0A641AQZ9_9ACTN|nr:DUF3618 domain-containing protein [Aeromicrobium fastidiosum]KAA1380359.1 DUF3618 domain-containing protein [Aeromicrobium fastidiosum]MBP2389926.1 hypothetical protein [Aeromicrobium fastidiosum]
MSSDLEQEIKETREHLGKTVDALAAKLDVKSRAQEKVAETDKRPILAIVVLAVGVLAAARVWPRSR